MTDEHKTTIMHAPVASIAPERNMHPLVAMAMRGGAIDPATLRELLAVQRDYEAGEARKAYSRALALLKRDLPTVIGKDATVDFANNAGKRTYYKHASLAGVMDAITDPLTRHGFSLAWIPSTGERGGVRVTCRLTHAEGHAEECSLDAPPDTSGSKSAAQAIASTITLLQRYTALALLGIATADQQEDTGKTPAAATDVDASRNLRAAKRLADLGLKREDAEKHVGRPVSAWTSADIETVAKYAERAKRIANGEDPNA